MLWEETYNASFGRTGLKNEAKSDVETIVSVCLHLSLPLSDFLSGLSQSLSLNPFLSIWYLSSSLCVTLSPTVCFSLSPFLSASSIMISLCLSLCHSMSLSPIVRFPVSMSVSLCLFSLSLCLHLYTFLYLHFQSPFLSACICLYIYKFIYPSVCYPLSLSL